MKLHAKKKKIDKVILQWDHKVLSSSNLEENGHHDYDKQRSLDEYFNLLDEIKPHIQELKQNKIFDKPFICFSRKI